MNPSRNALARLPGVAHWALFSTTAGALTAVSYKTPVIIAGTSGGLLAVRWVGATLFASTVLLVLSLSGGLLSAYGQVLGLLTTVTLVALLSGRRVPTRVQSVHVFAVVFVVLAVVHFVASAGRSPAYALFGLRGLILPIFAFAAAGNRVIHTKRGTRVLLAAVLLGATANAVSGIRQSVIGFTPNEMARLQQNRSTYLVGNESRLLGLLESNQDFGLLMAVGTSALTLGAAYGTFRFAQCLWLPAAVCGAALTLSLLRGPLIASALAVAVGLTQMLVHRSRKVVASVGIIGGFVPLLATGGVLLLPEERLRTTLERLSSLNSLGTDRSFLERIASTYPRALDALFSAPFGAGGGSAGPVSQQFPAAAPFGPLTPDNGYLLLAIQLGLPGLAVVAALIVSLSVTFARSRSAEGTVALGIVIAVAISMLFGGYWNLTGPMTVTAFFLGWLYYRMEEKLP